MPRKTSEPLRLDIEASPRSTPGDPGQPWLICEAGTVPTTIFSRADELHTALCRRGLLDACAKCRASLVCMSKFPSRIFVLGQCTFCAKIELWFGVGDTRPEPGTIDVVERIDTLDWYMCPWPAQRKMFQTLQRLKKKFEIIPARREYDVHYSPEFAYAAPGPFGSCWWCRREDRIHGSPFREG